MSLQEIDNSLITTINFDGPAAYDLFWWMYTDKWTWIPLALVVVWYLLRQSRDAKAALLVVAAFGLLFALSDQIPTSLIKPLACRLRPSHNPDILGLLSYVNDYHGGLYGFPSNHASNGFAAATFLTLLFRRRITSAVAFLWACGSCYSRMYLGVHYVSDILCGALLGVALAFAVFALYRHACLRLLKPDTWETFAARYRAHEPLGIAGIFAVTIVVLAFLSFYNSIP